MNQYFGFVNSLCYRLTIYLIGQFVYILLFNFCVCYSLNCFISDLSFVPALNYIKTLFLAFDKYKTYTYLTLNIKNVHQFKHRKQTLDLNLAVEFFIVLQKIITKNDYSFHLQCRKHNTMLLHARSQKLTVTFAMLLQY